MQLLHPEIPHAHLKKKKMISLKQIQTNFLIARQLTIWLTTMMRLMRTKFCPPKIRSIMKSSDTDRPDPHKQLQLGSESQDEALWRCLTTGPLPPYSPAMTTGNLSVGHWSGFRTHPTVSRGTRLVGHTKELFTQMRLLSRKSQFNPHSSASASATLSRFLTQIQML